MNNIEWHADDFALSVTQSEKILKSKFTGCLNGISIMVNSPNLNESLKLIDNVDLYKAIHLNLTEGRCITDNNEKVSILTDKNGVFNKSFINLLINSYLPARKKYKHAIKLELLNQIREYKKYIKDDSIRIDSHVHYHMIPVVFDSLIEIIKNENLNVEYIRVPSENIFIYIKNITRLKNIKLINIIKVILLNILSVRNRIKYKYTFKKNIPDKIFAGVMLSGHMFLDDVKIIYKELLKISKKKNKGIELLFHPGGIYHSAEIKNITNKDDYNFLTSDNRNLEFDALINITKEIHDVADGKL